MTDLQDNLAYMDKFLNPEMQSEERRAITEAFAGKNGNYLGMDYGSEGFKNEIAHLFMGPLTTHADLVRFDAAFEKLNDIKLTKILDRIILDGVIHIGGVIQIISPETWEAGERRNLPETYSNLVSLYAGFRKELAKKLS